MAIIEKYIRKSEDVYCAVREAVPHDWKVDIDNKTVKDSHGETWKIIIKEGVYYAKISIEKS